MAPPDSFQTPKNGGTNTLSNSTPQTTTAHSPRGECLECHNIFNPPSSAQIYKDFYEYHKDLNEAGFKTEILRLSVELDFEIQLEPARETSQAVLGPSESWRKGLRVQYNQRVNRGHIPHAYLDPQSDQRKVQDALKEGLLNAEPDAVWGFDPKNMSPSTETELAFLCHSV